jgi:hypothetical protein
VRDHTDESAKVPLTIKLLPTDTAEFTEAVALTPVTEIRTPKVFVVVPTEEVALTPVTVVLALPRTLVTGVPTEDATLPTATAILTVARVVGVPTETAALTPVTETLPLTPLVTGEAGPRPAFPRFLCH